MMRKLLAAAAAAALTVAFAAAPAFAGPPKDDGKCNSGRGNQSETTPETDCDPGNSAGHNSGGD
jgi:hypothetical protein